MLSDRHGNPIVDDRRYGEYKLVQARLSIVTNETDGSIYRDYSEI